MSTTDVSTYESGRTLAVNETPTLVQIDPTGGRLIAWAQAASAANALAKSLVTTTFVPKDETVGNATAKILMGDELGFSPLAALRSIYVVHGTPALYARSMVALAQSRGHEIWTEESTPTKVTVCGRRRGSDHVERATWTQDRARKAGYTSNRKYETNPEEMLYSKAAAEISRKVAADALAGVPYSVEDLELETPTTTTVTRESAVRRTVARAPKPEPVEPEIPEPEIAQPEPEPTPEPEPITASQLKALHASLSDAGMGSDRDGALRFYAETVGREVDSSKSLTKTEASKVIDALKSLTATDDPWADDPA